MKIYLTQFRELFNRDLVKLSFVFTLLLATSTLVNGTTNSSIYNTMCVENEKIKMSVIPDLEVEDQANINLYSATNEATIVIFNAMGMVVLEENFKVEKEKENTIQLDLSNLGKGTYYILHDETNDSATYSIQ